MDGVGHYFFDVCYDAVQWKNFSMFIFITYFLFFLLA